MKKIFFLFYILFSITTTAQLVVDNTSQTPKQLVQNVVVGQGINVSNIIFNGTAANADLICDQVGLFSNGLTTNIGLSTGIILSTGNAIIAKGANDTNLGTLPTSNPFIGDNDLYILSNNQSIQNVAILEFDFIPTGNKLSFNFVFASEEYPEFVNDTYNDNFGFFLSGPGITGPFSSSAKNIALIPTTTLPVSINNLNDGTSNSGPCEYCQYYVNNEGGPTIQYDGFTKVLSANADVVCGQTYHIKLAIANVGDNNYDSAVFIEGASFSSPSINLGPDLKICSASNHILNSGLSASEIHEWRYNGTLIPGQNGPQITIDKSGLYSVQAFPFGTTCPVSDEIAIQFGTLAAPYLYCGTKTSNSITFDWLALGEAEFSVAYKIGTNTVVDVGFIGKVYSYTVQDVPPGETVVITVTPIGTPSECFGPNSISCVLDSCLISPTLSLTQGASSQQTCENEAISNVVYTIGAGATTASITSGSLPNGVTTSLVANQFKIEGTPSVSGTFNYTITTSGGCAPNATLNGSITVNLGTIPTFTAVAPVCEGETLASLPLQSINNINGTWSPALNNNTTTEYTFTPNTGQCATTTKLTIVVNQKTTPTFTAVAPICSGEALAALPSQSINSINGTWSPTLNNTTTTEYTFTPNTGQCANTAKLTIVVNQKTTPTFTAAAPICAGGTIAALPLQSINNINGSWSPTLNNTATTEYTFTPNTGQCANTAKLTIVVNQKTTPTFTAVAPICSGEALAALPLQSINNINGSWSPALNNTASTEYTFTPNAGQCANTAKLTIVVNQKTTPTFTAIAAICEGETLAALPLQSNNSINGTWSPAPNNITTTEYTFTPNAGQCANQTKLTISVKPKPIPLLTDGKICVDKNSNAVIQSYLLDSKLNNATHNFEWFLDGFTILNATQSTFEATQKGTYSVKATNKSTNCSSTVIEAIVTETLSNTTTFKITQTNAFSDNATLTIAVIEGSANYEYQLDQNPFQESNVFSEVTPGTHTIRIVDTEGCTDLSYQVIVIGYPKFFTPNGDGHNDTWKIIGFNSQYNPSITIFDRYGKLLKQINSIDFGWDGTYNGQVMPATDYWFRVIYLEDGINKEFKSHFSLKR
ncbi:T9SS type B sorting domain-containing protein [Flavobacterium degerlachei]|jgi:gliding motility-associated-like protein|uniref:Gliding motility-associated C-terminal domain-containing protein n=1 Tax=Flavobacterium degerlachei TaxID=229203 RepID=A0A1H2U2Z1_9FLAO|nr:choice-of-anchor L domain-containing protein [Flavobacterium degerlachei]SDW50573.1 gliding motility-associated C-terminal domain-containing protein [Flavobacterium degerlachei]